MMKDNTGEMPMRALVVEDDTMVAKIFGMVIQTFFSDVNYAVNGEEGFACYRKAIDDANPYDVIFLDIMMPRVTGLEMLEMVRRDEAQRGIPAESGVSIIMLTALDDEVTMEKARRLQCDEYLKKPVNRTIIKATLVNLGLMP